MRKRFVAAREDRPGEAWRDRFVAGFDEARRWYLGQGLEPPPTPADCRTALALHMPELLGAYDDACALVGDDAIAHRILSHYRPAPEAEGCSQAVWLGRGGPALVRNYDYPLGTVSDRFEATSWFGRTVVAKAQRPWGGCLDGMNEDGLVASLTAGGTPAQGLGFSILLVLRYVLETCRRVEEGIAALRRIPVALAQNVTLLDRTGAYATVYLGPGREAGVTRERVCTNHQEVAWPGPATESRTVERKSLLDAALALPDMTLPALTERFLAPPVYSRRAGFTTVYTAVYRPAEGRVDYLWPGHRWPQGIERFEAGTYTHDYGMLEP